MTRMGRIAAAIAVAAVATAAGFLISSRHHEATLANPDSVTRLVATTLPDTSNTPQSLSQWRGKVLVVNFWATWCPPCREEIPAFVRLSEKYSARNVQFVGISIDSVDKVRDFAWEFNVTYPLLIANADTLQLVAGLGNKAQGLPFTLILDRAGRARQIKLGTLTEAQLDQTLAQLSATN